MSGIYIHIPFCKQKCSYCDFYTIVAPGHIDSTVNSIIQEIEIRKNYLSDNKINTIYFGGGTPSLLSLRHFESVFRKLSDTYRIDSNAEITLEANPDDLTDLFFDEIKKLPFNRLSIGIQSFNDIDLKKINRRHSANQAIECVKKAQNAGIDNISIDLIYGLPEQNSDDWIKNLEIALGLNIQHISAYGLTYEKGTVLWRQREKGIVRETGDELMNTMFEILRKKTVEAGFEPYEISNFCLPGYKSRHNSSYWNMIPYIGFGPSAHSYNTQNRQWNVSSVKKYNDAILNNQIFWEIENLTQNEKFNEYIMVALRTLKGCDSRFIQENFESKIYNYFINQAEKYLETGHLQKVEKFFSFTISGIEISDFIISDLMLVE